MTRKIVERQVCDINGEVAYSDDDDVVNRVYIEAKQIVVDDKAYLLDVCAGCDQRYRDMSIREVMEKGTQVPWKKNKVTVQGAPRSKKTKSKTKVKPDGKGEDHRRGKLPAPPITLQSDGKHHCPGCRSKYDTRRGLQKHWTQKVNANEQAGRKDAA